MSTMGDRLRQARENAGLSIEDAARALGVAQSTYTQHENGIRNYPAKRAASYAQFFRTTPEWLLYGRAGRPTAIAPEEKPTRRSRARAIPLLSWVTAGKLSDPTSQLPPGDELIEISGLPSGDYFATRVRGDSMDRVAPDGSTIIVDRSDRNLRRGRRYIFSYRGETTFKKYAPEPDRLEPESLNPTHEPIFPKDPKQWEVVGRVKLVVAEI